MPSRSDVGSPNLAPDEPLNQKPFVHIASPGSSKPGKSQAGSRESGQVVLSIGGELSAGTLPQIWPQALIPLRRMRPKRVEVDASRLTCEDSAYLALFAEIRRVIARRHGEVNIVGLKPDQQALLDLATLPDALAPALRPPPPRGFIAWLGEVTHDRLEELKTLVAFLGELCAGLAWAAAHPRQVRWRELVISSVKAGPDALPVVLLLGFLIGVMLAFQSAGQTERYGVRTVIPSVVAIAVTRELGPLIATLLLAGRTSSAYAAELGTMKVDQELNALRAMGLDPVRFLAVPRVLAVILIAPLLVAFCDLAGVIGGYSVMAGHGFSFEQYMVQANNALHWSDVFGGVGKSLVFALIVGAVGCLHGLETGNGSRAVGDSTTRAVVAAIVLIVAADGCFGVIYYYLGI